MPLVLPQPLQAGFEQAKVVGRLLPRFDANSPKNIDLLSRMKLGSAVQLSASNAKAAPSWDDSRLKAHAVAPLDLAQHQGIGMFVVGDGSGGTVVVRVICGTTARDYAVPLSFHGKRWVEIPSSEAGLRHRTWGAVGKGAALWAGINMSAVSAVAIGVGYLPANTSSSVTVSGLQALAEIEEPLVDPQITVGDQTVKAKATLQAYNMFTLSPDVSRTITAGIRLRFPN